MVILEVHDTKGHILKRVNYSNKGLETTDVVV